MPNQVALMIDPGHGGADYGAVNTATGLKEKDVVLSVSKKLQDLLSKHIKVGLTRSSDLFLPLSKRAQIANNFKACYFLSIHCNSAEAKNANGFEIFTTKGKTKSDDFASDIYDQWAKDFPNQRMRKDSSDGDPDKEANFSVLRNTDMPAALVELEFIHNAQGHAFLQPEVQHDAMANSLAKSIMKHMGISRIPPTTVSEPAHGTKVPIQEDTAAIVARISEDLEVLRKRFPYTL